MSNQVALNDLSGILSDSPLCLILGIGFDGRCLSIARSLVGRENIRFFGVCNINVSDETTLKALSDFKGLFSTSGLVLGFESSSVLETVDEVQRVIQENANSEILMDISSFSHELLVAIIGLLKAEDALKKTKFLYTNASCYSFNTPNDEVWLSRGVLDIRSILGFPGVMLPSKRLHLVLMMGFEVERASEVISRYEPYKISIGSGSERDSISISHHALNNEFVEKLKIFLCEQRYTNQEIYEFNFSCKDPFLTARELKDHLIPFSDENIVICPLNNKLSTIGASVFAIDNDKVQLCYAQAVEYNMDGYSMPGDMVTIVDFALR